MKKAVLVIVLCITGLTLFRFFGWEGANEISVYPIECTHDLKDGSCQKAGYVGGKQTYTIFPEKQEVIESFGSGMVQRLKECAIKDKDNWSCEYEDKSGKIGFAQGKFWNYANDSMSTEVGHEAAKKRYYVSREEWISQSCSYAKAWYLPCIVITAFTR